MMNKKFLGIISCGLLSAGLLVGCSGQEPQEGFDEDVPVNSEEPAAPAQTEPETETEGIEDPNTTPNEENTGTEADTESDVDSSIDGTEGTEEDTSTEIGEDATEDNEAETNESGF
jgi:hypothetical protein